MGVKHILALSCAATGQAYLLQGLVSTRPSALVSVQPARTAVCEMNMAERFARLVKSNVNQALNSMEDPEKVLTQAVEDMQKDLIKVRQAYAEVSASTKRMGEQCKVAEAEAQKAFDEFTSESAVNRAANAKDVEHKTTKKTNQEAALTAKKADLEGTQKELDAALAYYDKLKPSCVDAGVSYEDRVARRKEEIESLQEALRILNGEDIAFLQK